MLWPGMVGWLDHETLRLSSADCARGGGSWKGVTSTFSALLDHVANLHVLKLDRHNRAELP